MSESTEAQATSPIKLNCAPSERQHNSDRAHRKLPCDPQFMDE